MKKVNYNCEIENEIKFEGLKMAELCEAINEYFKEKYNGLISVNPTKIYNLINRPKMASKQLKKILKVSYSN